MGSETEDHDVDLSGVMPQRRETVRRRIAALEEYDNLPKRTSTELVRLCEPLGLSAPSFYRLWRSWRTLRDPATLQGATKTVRGLRDPVGDREYVQGLLASMPRDGSIEAQVHEIERQAAAQSVPVRSRSALRRLAREIRDQGTAPPLSASPEGMIGLDIVPIEIAVDDGGVATLPLAVIVLHPRTGSVLSVTLSLAPPSPASVAAALARWLDSLPAEGIGVQVDAAFAPSARNEEWTDLWATLRRYGLERSGPEGMRMPAGEVIAGSLGRRLLGIDVRPRMAHRPSDARRPLERSTRLGGPLSLAEAQAAMDERVESKARPNLFLPGARSLASDLRSLFAS